MSDKLALRVGALASPRGAALDDSEPEVVFEFAARVLSTPIVVVEVGDPGIPTDESGFADRRAHVP
jgi:hypothetical protein